MSLTSTLADLRDQAEKCNAAFKIGIDPLVINRYELRQIRLEHPNGQILRTGTRMTIESFLDGFRLGAAAGQAEAFKRREAEAIADTATEVETR